MKKTLRLCLAITTAATLFCGINSLAHAGKKHLFYFNGVKLDIVGDDGYNTIIQSLKDDGFDVIYEPRYEDGMAVIDREVKKTVKHVNDLIAAGTLPEDIIISGYSFGSVISMYTALALNNPKINYVFIAGCPVHVKRHFDIDYANIHGRVLSIADKDDDKFGSCGNKISGASSYKEVMIQSGKGHKGFRLPKLMDNWKKPMEAWANEL